VTKRFNLLSSQEFSGNSEYLKQGSFARDFAAQAKDAGFNDFQDKRQQEIAYRGYPESRFPWNYPGQL